MNKKSLGLNEERPLGWQTTRENGNYCVALMGEGTAVRGRRRQGRRLEWESFVGNMSRSYFY